MTTIQLPENGGSFLRKCIQHYEKMQHEIRQCRKKEHDVENDIQCCFDVASSYRVELLNMVTDYEFESESEEIFFFKQIKPLFTAEVEYYSFRYHAELFSNTVEDNDPMEIELFYQRQLQRMDRFSRENFQFYDYVSEGRSDKDSCWFTRCNAGDIPENERRNSSSHDKLMGTYIALKKYIAFVNLELKRQQ